jgi:hypothetical protein
LALDIASIQCLKPDMPTLEESAHQSLLKKALKNPINAARRPSPSSEFVAILNTQKKRKAPIKTSFVADRAVRKN